MFLKSCRDSHNNFQEHTLIDAFWKIRDPMRGNPVVREARSQEDWGIPLGLVLFDPFEGK